MRKKLFLLLLTIVCCVCLAFGVSACATTGGSSSDSGNTGDSISDSSDSEEDTTPSVVTYTVTYDANGGYFAGGSDTYTLTVDFGSTLIAPTSPTRKGFTFAGWTTSQNDSVTWSFSSDVVTADITLYASWNEKTASILSVENASIDGEDIFMLVDSNDSLSLSSIVTCSSDSTWKLYYDELGQTEIPTRKTGTLSNGDNYFYIVVTSTDGTVVNSYALNVYLSYAVNINYYNGNALIYTEKANTGYSFATSYVPDITGYTFYKWLDEDGTEFTSAIIWDSVNLTADKTANTYTITYNVQSDETLTANDKVVTYDSNYTLAIPEKTGYTFAGWYYSTTQLTDSNGKSVSVWSYAKDLTVSAKWAINQYMVSLNLSDNDAGSVTGGGNYDYNKTVTIKATTNNGYTWVGWYDNIGNVVTFETSYSVTIGVENVSYTAKWSKTTIESNNSSAGNITSLSRTYVIGDEVIITAITNSGYTWVGWYVGDTLYTQELSFTHTMTDDYITYTAKWTYYTVTISASGNGTTSYKSKKVTVGETYTISASAYLGYEVSGWYVDDEKVADTAEAAFTMEAKNVAYTVYFEVKDEMSNFIFTSTVSTCAITGISDNTVTEIIVPDYVTSISEGSFSGCSNLVSITLPFIGYSASETSASSSTLFGYIFGTSEYTGGISTVQYYTSINYITYYIPVKLTTVMIRGGNILDKAFWGCTSLESITITDSVTSIGECAFWKCTSLESITILDSVTSIGVDAFGYCTSLESITIPDSVTSIGNYAFNNCTSLESITIPGSVTSIGNYAFEYCTSLESITIPDSVTSIGDYAFYRCTSLTSVYYHGTVSHWASISFSNFCANPLNCAGGNLYFNGTLATKVTIGNGITSIGDYAFYKCTSITSVTIGDSVTSIGDYAFYQCTSLTSVTVGDGVTHIGEYAFAYCTSLTSVTFKDTTTWYYTSSRYSTSTGTSISSSNLSNTSTAATYLNSTYYKYYWYKK